MHEDMLGEDSFFQREAVYPMICTNCYIFHALLEGKNLDFFLFASGPAAFAAAASAFRLVAADTVFTMI
jgi:hypothetical protein